jgi:heptosyltransferase II
LKILIIKQTSLGDVLHSTVAVNMLKSYYPRSSITFMVDKSAYDLIKYNKKIDEIIIFDLYLLKNTWVTKPNQAFNHIKDKIKQIRKTHYDLAFDLQGLFRSVFFLYLAKASRKYVKGRWLFLNKYKNNRIHAVNEIKSLINKAISKDNPEETIPTLTNKFKDTNISIYTSEEENQHINQILEKINPENKRILIISPFTRWQSKNWGDDSYIDLLRLIDGSKYIAILTGSKDRKADIDNIINQANRDDAVNLAGELSLLQFTELLRHADLLLSSDGFPVHLASAVNTRLIAIFGPTSEVKVGPISRNSLVMRGEDPCKRCGKRVCLDKRCMKSLLPEKVYRHIEKMIEEKQTKKP